MEIPNNDAYRLDGYGFEDVGFGTEAADGSVFVEIPMAGNDGGAGKSLQITRLQMSVENNARPADVAENIGSSGRSLAGRANALPGFRSGNAEMAMQAGNINLLIYSGVQEATLRTVMKVVMDHA